MLAKNAVVVQQSNKTFLLPSLLKYQHTIVMTDNTLITSAAPTVGPGCSVGPNSNRAREQGQGLSWQEPDKNDEILTQDVAGGWKPEKPLRFGEDGFKSL